MKSIEVMIKSQEQKVKMMDSQFSQESKIQDPYSMFQVHQQEEEPMDSNRSMKNLIQSKNNFFQSIDRLEAQISHYINIAKDMNEETLPSTCSIIPNCPSHIDRNEESWCHGDFDQDSISPHKFELNQFQTLEKLESFSFNENELECECDPDP